MCNRIRKIADRCCCAPPPTPPPPIRQLISGMLVILPWDLQTHWYRRALGPLPPDLPRRMNTAQRRALTNSLKLQEVPGGLCHLQTTQSGAKSIRTVSKWRPCEDTVKAHAVSGQNPWPGHYLNRTMHHSIFQKYQ